MTIPYEEFLRINAKVTNEFKKKKLTAKEEKARQLKQRADDLRFKMEIKEIENEYN